MLSQEKCPDVVEFTEVQGSSPSLAMQLTNPLWPALTFSLVAQLVKNPPAMWETWVRSLGWEDPLEEVMAAHPSILAWRIPMDRGAWRARVHGVTKSWTGLSD